MTQIEAKVHAELGPSGWSTWSNCPGAPVLGEGIVDKGSTYANEGTAAHSLLETCLTEGFDAEELIGKRYEVEGDEFVVDMDMADAVNTAIAKVRELIDPARGDVLLVEQAVPIGQLTGETGAEGTSDVVGIVDERKTLVVIDFKYGKGVQVYASEKLDEMDAAAGATPQPNGQLGMYGLGTLEKLGLIYDSIERVKLVIIQPRCGDGWVDEFTMPVEDLLAFGDEVRIAAGRVQLERQSVLEGNGELTLIPGEKQCRFCKAKAICPALRNQVTAQLAPMSEASDFDDLTLPKQASSVVIGDHTSADRLAEFMRAAPLIEDAIKAVRAEVERRLFAGLPVPGFKLVEGKKGNRKWRDEEEAATELTKSGRLSAAKAYSKKPISPTQAEKKLADRPKVWAKIAPLITQSPGGPSVAPESDPRPALMLVSDQTEFEDLSAEPSVESLMDGSAPEPSVDDLMA